MSNLIKKYIVLPFLLAIFSLVSCELFEPVDTNYSTFDRVLYEPVFAEGILAVAYNRIPSNSYSFNDVATDDAVSNDKTNSYMRMATGEWTSNFNPMNQWSNCLEGIQSANHFLTFVEDVGWRPSVPELHDLYIRRLKGEAYGVRALLKYHLLITVAGEGANGQMLGIPILNEYLENTADFNIPRATFTASVNSIYDDIDMALSFLTMDDYRNVTDASLLPSGYENVNVANYNIVFGREAAQRFSGIIAKALRAKVAILEASPAYTDDNRTLWEKAARYTGELLSQSPAGGPAGLDPNGHRWFLKNFFDEVNLTAATPVDRPEMLWRSRRTPSRDLEEAHFPPTLFGNGRLNPTQNLVDAFPMENGYPIDDELNRGGYNANDPYAGRDPRLRLYITLNGDTYKNSIINTGLGGRENAKDSIDRSTRTGYYLKKLLVEQTNVGPIGASTENHYVVYFRYTDFFLLYAEAANEAWGPDGDDGGFGFTAREVIGAIRQRAGITQPDTYLAGIDNKENMRKLIRNERRLELCFEGHRFWDLRRWKENLNVTARGVVINKDATEYRYVDVEQRLFTDYMYYGPIPNPEINRYSNLIQNKGW